jgi:hypothetical protein
VKAEKTAIKKGLQRWFKKTCGSNKGESKKTNKNLNFMRGPNTLTSKINASLVFLRFF